MSDLLERVEYTRPLYSQPEAAALVDVPPPTFRNWSRGYVYKTLAGEARSASPLVTTTRLERGQVVPFVGLGEAYVLAAFRRTGVPMQRIRPALAWLEQHIGLQAALTSQKLLTDGAEVLWEFSQAGDRATSDEVGQLVVVRNRQIVFREVVQEHLRAITYEEGRVTAIALPRLGPDVVVDPRLNAGRPTFASRGVRVADVLSRVAAGESAEDVAADYQLYLAAVQAVLVPAA